MKVTKLSPAMQDAMWSLYSDAKEAPKALSTWRGLESRDLIINAMFARILTDAGRAWIAEQIETAHAEANAEARSRQGWAMMGRHEDCPRGCKSARLASAELAVECDHAEAREINELSDKNAAYCGKGRMYRHHLTGFMTVGALRAIIDGQREQIERDHAEAHAEQSRRDGGCGHVDYYGALAAPAPCSTATPCRDCQASADIQREAFLKRHNVRPGHERLHPMAELRELDHAEARSLCTECGEPVMISGDDDYEKCPTHELEDAERALDEACADPRNQATDADRAARLAAIERDRERDLIDAVRENLTRAREDYEPSVNSSDWDAPAYLRLQAAQNLAQRYGLLPLRFGQLRIALEYALDENIARARDEDERLRARELRIRWGFSFGRGRNLRASDHEMADALDQYVNTFAGHARADVAHVISRANGRDLQPILDHAMRVYGG